jgi:hypothetical protein
MSPSSVPDGASPCRAGSHSVRMCADRTAYNAETAPMEEAPFPKLSKANRRLATSLAVTAAACDSRRLRPYRSERMSSRPSPEKLAAHQAQYASGRTCRHCHRHKLPAELTSHYGMVQRVCLKCREDQKQNRLGLAGDNRDIDSAPDPAPARHLRAVLASDRDQGVPWSSERFDELVAFICSDLRDDDAKGWRYALNSTESVWAGAYDGSGAPSRLTADLCAGSHHEFIHAGTSASGSRGQSRTPGARITTPASR